MPEQRSRATRSGPTRSAIGCSAPRSARCRRAWTARTRSPPGTAPARAAARRSAPATSSTLRCGPRRGSMVAANATGCLEVFSTPFPESSWQLPWIHSLFGNAPAVASGVAAAMRAKGREDIRVVGQAGDGGTVDIGFACLSGMFERGDDVLFVCYDNEAYMNTGVQRSGRDPAGGAHGEHEAGRPGARQRLRPGQERADDRDGPRDPVRRHRHRRRAARPRGQGDEGDGDPRRPLHPRLRPLPARLGIGLPGHDPARPPGQGDRPVPGLRGRARRGHRGLEDPPTRAGRPST